jgi:hypothetical protein
VKFQYGHRTNLKSNVQQGIAKRLEANGIPLSRVWQGHANPSSTVQEELPNTPRTKDKGQRIEDRGKSAEKGEAILPDIQKAEAALSAMYKRHPGTRWCDDDERLLVDLMRPTWFAELEELKTFRATNPQYPQFPDSIQKLLRQWDATLDRARNYEPDKGSNTAGAQRFTEASADYLKRNPNWKSRIKTVVGNAGGQVPNAG